MTTGVDCEADESAIGQFARAGRGALPVEDIGRLLLHCADRPGLVAAVTTFLTRAGANIISLDQHSTEQTGGTFMQRTVFHLSGLTAARDALAGDFVGQVAEKFDMDFRLTEAATPKRVAVMASREDHCLLDLLWRNRRGDLNMSVVMVLANHPDLAEQVRSFGTPFIHIPADEQTPVAANAGPILNRVSGLVHLSPIVGPAPGGDGGHGGAGGKGGRRRGTRSSWACSVKTLTGLVPRARLRFVVTVTSTFS
jgi:predicted amino acid-binding ACT domain protein